MRVETLLDLSPRKIIEIIRRYVYPTELQRVAKMNRYTPAMVKFLDKKIHIVDSVSYIGMIDEIFIKRNYEFKSPKESPKIIDVGANIGLSIIFFKQLYPKSIITAFEADPIIFRALEKNIAFFNFEDVVLYERAAWKENTTLEFFSEGSWSGRIKKGLDDKSLIKVQTVRLRDFLNEEIDFLKLDVEGAETEILKDCADVIGNVKNIFVEYHHYYSEPQTLHDILKILAENGFDYHIKESFVAKHPFIERPKPAGMDFQVDIFAFKN